MEGVRFRNGSGAINVCVCVCACVCVLSKYIGISSQDGMLVK